jgi:hypothetical protein
MPPQQSDGLLDFFFERKRFGAHGFLSFRSWRAFARWFARKLEASQPDVKACVSAPTFWSIRAATRQMTRIDYTAL